MSRALLVEINTEFVVANLRHLKVQPGSQLTQEVERTQSDLSVSRPTLKQASFQTLVFAWYFHRVVAHYRFTTGVIASVSSDKEQ